MREKSAQSINQSQKVQNDSLLCSCGGEALLSARYLKIEIGEPGVRHHVGITLLGLNDVKSS